MRTLDRCEIGLVVYNLYQLKGNDKGSERKSEPEIGLKRPASNVKGQASTRVGGFYVMIFSTIIENVPKELALTPQWVCWSGTVGQNGKMSKIPINPSTGRNAKTDDPCHVGNI